MTPIEHPVRTDLIVCPSCDHEQEAHVTYTDGDPFVTFIHTCEKCGYIIMESEWETVDRGEVQR